MHRDVAVLIKGGVGGAMSTVAMSAVMVMAQKIGALGGFPPEQIAAAGLDAVKAPRKRETQDALALALHFSFGSAVGALFALLNQRMRLPPHPVLQGVVFGTLVWAVSYQGWIPALGILPPPKRDRPGRPVSMLLAHWTYGAVLGALVGQSSRWAANEPSTSV